MKFHSRLFPSLIPSLDFEFAICNAHPPQNLLTEFKNFECAPSKVDSLVKSTESEPEWKLESKSASDPDIHSYTDILVAR